MRVPNSHRHARRIAIAESAFMALFIFNISLFAQLHRASLRPVCGGPVVHNTTQLAQHNGNKTQHNGISTTQWKQAATQQNEHNTIKLVLCVVLCCGDLVVLCTTGTPYLFR